MSVNLGPGSPHRKAHLWEGIQGHAQTCPAVNILNSYSPGAVHDNAALCYHYCSKLLIIVICIILYWPIFRKVLSSAGRMGCLPLQSSGCRLAADHGDSNKSNVPSRFSTNRRVMSNVLCRQSNLAIEQSLLNRIYIQCIATEARP